ADEERLPEQIRVAVELSGLENHVAFGNIGQVLDPEQKKELLADPCLEILEDLRLGQHTVVDRNEPDHAAPRPIAGDFVAENEGEGVVPVRQQPARRGIETRYELAVHVYLAALDRIERRDDVLERRL